MCLSTSLSTYTLAAARTYSKALEMLHKHLETDVVRKDGSALASAICATGHGCRRGVEL